LLPVTAAPLALDARLRGICTVRLAACPGVNVVAPIRACPCPGACAMKVYEPGTRLTWSVSGVAGAVSAPPAARAWESPTNNLAPGATWPVSSTRREGIVASSAHGEGRPGGGRGVPR